MPTKDFQRDLSEASIPGRFLHLTRVRAGEGDGSISFTYTNSETGNTFHFEAVVADPHDYPSSHTLFVYSTSENVPAEIIKAVDEVVSQFEGFSIHDVLSNLDRIVSDAIQGINPRSSDDVDDLAVSSDQELEDNFDPSDWTEDEDNIFASFQNSAKLREKIRRDLCAVKLAGFKVGYHGDPVGSIIVSVAIRITKMGISEEAMSAWNVRPAEYLVLLIRYSPYQTMEDLRVSGDPKLQMRVGLCDSYKPSPQSAIKAFQEAVHPDNIPSKAEEQDSGPVLRGLFIGTALNKLLNERFLDIARLRLKHGFSWTGAEFAFHTSQGRAIGPDDASSPEYARQNTWMTTAPNFLQVDHMADMRFSSPHISLPLLAELFLIRHFVKCTEFCLVCHCKTNDSFEALKPYVCSNGLCLFQYMTLGMGPNLEYEIRSQPYVVDMLISLAYARAQSGRLTDFPTGLGLTVPDVTVPDPASYQSWKLSAPNSTANSFVIQGRPEKYYEATLFTRKMELFHDFVPRVKVANWIAILNPNRPMTGANQPVWHCRVQHVGETSGYVTLSSPVFRGAQLRDREGIEWEYPDSTKVMYVIYNMNFDELPAERKRSCILMLLGNLPSIDSMLEFLGPHESGKSLASWQEMIIPAALDLLRWIVASNRSCILQDGMEADDLVSDMKGFLQFRLVQGAPDKEQRFMEAVNQRVMHTKSAYPTIFAWHGSPLYNWHSILREGLHFNEVAHGRAYGNGVYLSSQYATSSGYGGYHSPQYRTHNWPQSKLNIQSMISLNEIVNDPAQFVSVSPHYVVKHLDWIQPRYLFVQVADSLDLSGIHMGAVPSVVYEQDSAYPVIGPDSRVVKIPISAVSSQRRQGFTFSPRKTSNKKKRNSKGTPVDFGLIGDAVSVSTAIEDLTVLLSESEEEIDEDSPKKKKLDPMQKTDFVPGTLKEETLPLLSPPAYATSPATALLQRHLQTTLKTQETEPLHELGWYVDPSLIRTVYQLIVELHTFDPTLPLAQDLKTANLTSIVLEVRFPPQFPMDPPFVRIIRPRFLDFAQGGGGHVTAGGAICMELLTNSGWSAVTSIESLLLQVRIAISTEDHPARLVHGRQLDYSIGEAVAAYTRACMAHGWEIPRDMKWVI